MTVTSKSLLAGNRKPEKVDVQQTNEVIDRIIRLSPQLRLAPEYEARIAPAVNKAVDYLGRLVAEMPAAREQGDGLADQFGGGEEVRLHDLAKDFFGAGAEVAEAADAYFQIRGNQARLRLAQDQVATDQHLLERGARVKVHDPVVPASVAPWTVGTSDPMAAASGADVLVIATPWPQYRELRPNDLARVMKGRTLLDPYRVLDGGACAAAGLTYHTLGMPPLAPAA